MASDGEFSEFEIDLISETTLSDIILRNTELESLQENVFFAAQAVPEPRTIVMIVVALAGLSLRRRRVRRSRAPSRSDPPCSGRGCLPCPRARPGAAPPGLPAAGASREGWAGR